MLTRQREHRITLRDCYNVTVLGDLRYIDVPIVCSEVDQIDLTCQTREYQALGKWKDCFTRLRSLYYKNVRNGVIPDTDIQIHMSSCKMKLEKEPPYIQVFAECMHILIEDERISIAIIPEIADEEYLMNMRNHYMNRWPACKNPEGRWSPYGASPVRDRGNMEVRDMIIANRLFVLSSSAECAETLVTYALLSI